IAQGAFGFSGAFAAARGTPDSLTWLARSRLGEGAAFLAGGRFARRAAQPGGGALAVGLDSLAVQFPGDAWVLERPTELTVTDSAATVTGLVLQSSYGSGKLGLEGALPTRGRADAHLQLEGFPLVGLYALLQQDTAGVGGMVTATAGLRGTRGRGPRRACGASCRSPMPPRPSRPSMCATRRSTGGSRYRATRSPSNRCRPGASVAGPTSPASFDWSS